MCCCCDKPSLKITSIVFLVIFGLLTIAGLIYNIFYMFDRMGIIQIVAYAVMIASVLFGIISFCCESSICLILFAILQFLECLFLAATGILTLIVSYYARKNRQSRTPLSCDSSYYGVLQYYNYLDKYLQEVDSGLCSTRCPCNFNNSTSSIYSSYYPDIFKTWTINSTGATQFQNCSQPLQYTTYLYGYGADFTSNNINSTIIDFANEWNKIERKYNCSGFCNTTYVNSNSQNITMVKYLFSDINKGVPRNRGCMPFILDEMSKVLDVTGAIALTVSVFMFMVFLFACTFVCCSSDSKSGDGGRSENNEKVEMKNV